MFGDLSKALLFESVLIVKRDFAACNVSYFSALGTN